MSPHVSDPEPQWETIFSTLSNVTLEIKNRFIHADGMVPILPVLGNHDTFPKVCILSSVKTNLFIAIILCKCRKIKI